MTDGIAFHTPDHDGGETVCMRLSLPSLFWRYFYGAFGELCEAYNWLQVGTMTPFEASQVFIDAMDAMRPCNMIGQVIMLATSELPEGVLLCDGAEYSKDDYPELYEVIYPSLQGRDTFNTPDLRDRFVLCEGVTAFGETGGEAEHTLTVDEMPTHTHEYTTALPSVSTVVIPDEPSAVPSPSTTAPSGGNQPHNNMPPYYALIFGIVAK